MPEPYDDDRFVAVCREQPVFVDSNGSFTADRVVFAPGDSSFTLTDLGGTFELQLGVDEDVFRFFEGERTVTVR